MKVDVCWDYSMEVRGRHIELTREFCTGELLLASPTREDCPSVISGHLNRAEIDVRRAINCPLGSYSYLVVCDDEVTAARGVFSPYPIYICRHPSLRISTRDGDGCSLLEPGTTFTADLSGSNWAWRSPSRFYDLSEVHEFENAGMDVEELVKLVADVILECYRGLFCHVENPAVSFSGGIDSSLLAFLASNVCNQRPLLYTVSGERGKGVDQAMESASELGLPMEVIVLDVDDVRRLLSSSAGGSLMDKALYLGFAAVAQRAMEDGLRYVMVGQLADELFAGYKKYERYLDDEDALRRAMSADLHSASEGLVRDFSSFVDHHVIPLFPYTCNKLVSLSLAINPKWKLFHGMRKYLLRKAAERIGLPSSLAWREKKAFQYSSGLEGLIRKSLS